MVTRFRRLDLVSVELRPRVLSKPLLPLFPGQVLLLLLPFVNSLCEEHAHPPHHSVPPSCFHVVLATAATSDAKLTQCTRGSGGAEEADVEFYGPRLFDV